MVPTRCLQVVLPLLCLLGCAPQGRDAPLRSPTLDYRPPPPQTSDGRVVGVDGKPPEDRLGEGPSGERLAPGWERDERGQLRYNPRKRVGGAVQGGETTPPSGSGPR